MKRIGIVIAMFIFTYSAYAQRTVSGTIDGDDVKETLVGATVIVKGTTTGTFSDIDGKYSIAIPDGDVVLIISYTGYESQEKNISADQTGTIVVNITMGNSAVGLNAVVVSASKRKEKIIDAPASVTVIGSEKLETNVALTTVDNLKTTPGVDIMQTGLISSNVNIRGFNNIFSGAMLTIVDNRIARVPSLRVNAFQLIPTSNYDLDRIEVVRGPGSALYGPNAADGVLAMFSRSPLDLESQFETTVSQAAGNGFDSIAGGNGIFKTELWHGGRSANSKFGYKISGSYMTGNDFQYYDPREPDIGDTVQFGSARFGEPFIVDTATPTELFDRDFDIRNYNFDMRVDFAPTDDIVVTLNGGLSNSKNLELTGLGAAQVQGRGWNYWYAQARFQWKELFVQYFVNGSNSGDTYLIPQVSEEADDPHNLQFLTDKSKLHVAQIQHNSSIIDRINLTYGIDALFTVPETEGSINGRYEELDNVFQTGAYLQADFQVHPKVKLVAATRGDWHSDVDGVFWSPRAAITFKPTARHTMRGTYNRAFSSPSTLNLALDLSNGIVPNGINIRGIGNPDGYTYNRDDNGIANFINPFNNTWNSVGDLSDNHVYFDGIASIIGGGLADQAGVAPDLVNLVLGQLFIGITGDTGTINSVNHRTVDYVQLLENGDFTASAFDHTTLQDLDEIKNSVTQTWELGYKGIIKDKLFITLDGWITKNSDYVSPLTNASPSVMLDPTEVIGALGAPAPGGPLWDNISNLSPAINDLLVGLLDGNPTYVDPSGAIPSIDGTVWDEVAVILAGATAQVPIGTVTPESEFVNSDVILTYIQLKDILLGGLDLGFSYYLTEEINFGGSFSWVNKDTFALAGASNGFIALNAPKFKFALTTEYTSKKIGLTTRLTWRWQDGFPASSAVYEGDVRAAHFGDINIVYALPFSKTTKISLDVSNFTNNQFQRFPGTPAMGTILMGRISHTFKSKKQK